MQHPILRAIARLERYANKFWYTPLVALLAFVDLFILLIPTDALVISNAALKPRKWAYIALWTTFGSAFGAYLLVLGVQHWGDEFLGLFNVVPQGSENWERAAEWIRAYQGPALALFGVGPFPLQPAVILAAAAEVSPGSAFFWVFLGRALKYFFFAWAATHAPSLLGRMWGIRREVEVLRDAQKELSSEAPTSGEKVPNGTGG